MLDTDDVRSMSWDGEGIKLAINSVLKHDPSYPKPLMTGEGGLMSSLWGLFKGTYFDAADRLAMGRHDGAEWNAIKSLPRRFTQK